MMRERYYVAYARCDMRHERAEIDDAARDVERDVHT